MYVIEEFLSKDGRSPFRQWLDALDEGIQQHVLARVHRFQTGNLGDHKKLTKSLFEARFFFGPGYRLYFAKVDGRILLLLCGGDKSSQQKDIARAQQYLEEYLEDGHV